MVSFCRESRPDTMLSQWEQDKHTQLHTLDGEVGSSLQQIRSQSLISHSLYDVITTERGHMDGMQYCLNPRESPFCPSNAVVSAARMNSCLIYNSHLTQIILICSEVLRQLPAMLLGIRFFTVLYLCICPL